MELIEFRPVGLAPRFQCFSLFNFPDTSIIDAGHFMSRERLGIEQGVFMQTGNVKWFNSQKGFGFIQSDSGGSDVFVHISAVEHAGMSALNDGQKLSFELETDPRSGKTSATNLKAA